MAQLLPKFRTKFGTGIGVELWMQLPDLSANEVTFFDADEASGQSALSANGANFSANEYVILGQPGVEKTEIAQVSSASSTLLNVSTGVSYAHSRGDRITFIPYNQIVIERSTDSGDNYTPLSAISIRVDATETYFPRTADAVTDFYRFRFFNSDTGLYSAYSDEVVATGFADNSVYSIKHRALRSLGEEIGGKITDQFLNEALWEARREVDQDDRVLRWSFRTKFNTDIGDVIPGRWSVAVPSDLRDPNTWKNILSLRIGRNNVPIEYQDNTRFRQNYLGVAHSTLNGSITTSSTSIILTSSGDFNESGAIDIAAEDITEEIDNVDYTTNTESTATLGTVTNIDNNHATDRDVWQGLGFGNPRAYTIDNETLYFDVPFSNQIAGENIVMDYYQKLQPIDSEADVVDEPDYDMYVSWLRWKIKYLKSNGKLVAGEDSDYREYRRRVETMINKEMLGQDVYLIPDTMPGTGFRYDA